ncbi:hypothetical protein A5780_18720 [Nocardia sp. 852002-20019_SCH5090214]|uniref:HEAT repeat domain-containing protein n=1 Tax=Nocardia nova TaxID=37330 RepID=A0A2S6AFD8_9NOCA|nr:MULTISPECIES: hypothetical protein [Nocardia]OBF70897.1 hypothetical protein A9X06_30450 [Mycobacterium sp. 852002-51759_SCH5129042]MBF6276096.1 hypothetical protein [Nocardia nova]OBA54334.1 hypothetical protein A5789_22050 [Nocardia sp. 852002-51101_SCH5132738]OBA62322.1 hypothetical protein A5780_18720 [Nocardia sp. 852002-20019_SCH5090214]OBB49820.1 hypothetical protein A5748_18920 [Nocardia sp. 852002-51244_SCH5132740]
MNTYQRLEPIDRETALSMIDSGVSESAGEAILRLALHDPDLGWVTDRALELLASSDWRIRAVAATALGHLARLHGGIDKERVVPALRALLDDEATAGRAEDALDDITMFAP